MVKDVIDSSTPKSFETIRLPALARDVVTVHPVLMRSIKAVLIVRLIREAATADRTAASTQKITRSAIRVVRPFSHVFYKPA